MGVRAPTMVRMLLNLAIDSTIGSIPLLGDLFDFVWKANVKNLDLLERHLHDPIRAGRSDRVVVVALAGVATLVCLAPVVVAAYVLMKLMF